jgi:hypothetical protein
LHITQLPIYEEQDQNQTQNQTQNQEQEQEQGKGVSMALEASSKTADGGESAPSRTMLAVTVVLGVLLVSVLIFVYTMFDQLFGGARLVTPQTSGLIQ